MRPFLSAVLARITAIAILIVLLGSSYLFVIRPAQLHWGATTAEIAQTMPEDDLVDHPVFDATRAITIYGTPEQIWPWLAQMGFGRAGFYGYDLIENAGSGAGIRSARTILPAYQNLRTGDPLPISVAVSLVFGTVQPNSVMVWHAQDVPCTGVFIWQLVPLDAQHTRLISRIRWKYAPGLWIQTLDVFTEFADHVAVRKILEGVRDRTEGRAPESLAVEGAIIAGWLLAFFEFCAAAAAVVFSRKWKAAWLFALGAGALLQFVLYSNAPVWVCALVPWLYLAWMISSWRRRQAKRRLTNAVLKAVAN
jgi:hypothetical protein